MGSKPIAWRQEELDQFHHEIFPPPKVSTPKRNGSPGQGVTGDENEILSLALANPRNGARIARLYSGDTSAYKGISEAEFAFCSLLAYYVGPNGHDMLDRLYRNSNLYQARLSSIHPDKWDEPRNPATTWGRKFCIDKAIAMCGNFWKPFVPRESPPPHTDADIPPSGDVAEHPPRGGRAQRSRKAQRATPTPDDADLAGIPPCGCIPAPERKNSKGHPEYATYQIAQMLGLPSVAADTNLAMAHRATRVYRDELCYSKELGFTFWNGKHWQMDDKEGSSTAYRFANLSQLVRDEAITLFEHVQTLIKAGRSYHAMAMDDAARAHLKHVKIAEGEKFARSSMVLARDSFSVQTNVFDIRPFVIGFENGTWDRGEWREHRRKDYLLHQCPVLYDPEADRSEWLALLDRITGKDAENGTEASRRDADDFALTLQDVAGYCLSGASHLRLLPWLYGPKGTGKGTFSELLLTLLGSQAASVDPVKLSDSSRERLGADIWNRRVALCAEAGHKRIDPELLKTLSGGDTYPVRHLFHEGFNGKPTHVLLMVANDPPNMSAYDDALKDRVIALPFVHSLRQGPPIDLSDGLRLEEVRKNPHSKLVQGFTAWAVEGLERIHRNQAVHYARVVRNATKQFWEDTDPLSEFWNEWCIVEITHDNNGREQHLPTETRLLEQLTIGLPKAKVRRQYELWCQQQGIKKPMGPKLWKQACESRGLYEVISGDSTTRMWRIFELNPQFVKATMEERTDTTDTTEGISENPYKKNNISRVPFEKSLHSVSTVSTSTVSEAPETSPEPLTPEDFKDAFVAARDGVMPEKTEAIPIVDGRSTDAPRGFLLSIVEASRPLRAEHGASWPEQGDGIRLFGDWEALARWWKRNRHRYDSPPKNEETVSETPLPGAEHKAPPGPVEAVPDDERVVWSIANFAGEKREELTVTVGDVDVVGFGRTRLEAIRDLQATIGSGLYEGEERRRLDGIAERLLRASGSGQSHSETDVGGGP